MARAHCSYLSAPGRMPYAFWSYDTLLHSGSYLAREVPIAYKRLAYGLCEVCLHRNFTQSVHHCVPPMHYSLHPMVRHSLLLFQQFRSSLDFSITVFFSRISDSIYPGLHPWRLYTLKFWPWAQFIFDHNCPWPLHPCVNFSATSPHQLSNLQTRIDYVDHPSVFFTS